MPYCVNKKTLPDHSYLKKDKCNITSLTHLDGPGWSLVLYFRISEVKLVTMIRFDSTHPFSQSPLAAVLATAFPCQYVQQYTIRIRDYLYEYCAIGNEHEYLLRFFYQTISGFTKSTVNAWLNLENG